MPRIVAAANTIIPAIVTLESLGFNVRVVEEGAESRIQASRGDDTFIARDPETVLGLVRLVELRSWNWRASDADIERVLAEYPGL